MVAMEHNYPELPDSVTMLDSITSDELRRLYQQVLETKPPSRASRVFLMGNIVWTQQVQARKQNPTVLRSQLIKRAMPSRQKKVNHYKPGTRLVREWHGVTYEVVVTDDGYLWQDRVYRSLTAIAREITGANWSGPRFFGLLNKKR
jgi:hypothetical protein